jgi:hypothetical protein
MPEVWALDSAAASIALAALRAGEVCWWGVEPLAGNEEEDELELGWLRPPGVVLPFDMEALRPGREGRACDMAFRRPLTLVKGGAAVFG